MKFACPPHVEAAFASLRNAVKVLILRLCTYATVLEKNEIDNKLLELTVIAELVETADDKMSQCGSARVLILLSDFLLP